MIMSTRPGAAVSYVTASELRLMLQQQKTNFPGHEKVTVIDVRDHDRSEGGHIPGSTWIPSQEFRQQLPKLVDQYRNERRTLVFHCMFSQSRGPTCAKLFANAVTTQEDQRQTSGAEVTQEDAPSSGTSSSVEQQAYAGKVRILRGGFIGWETENPDMVESATGEEGPRNFYVFDEVGGGDDAKQDTKQDTTSFQ
ncbi:unnamed protein product [Amoebophrya sp. A25]|nr:unnamed protein product [Amoebophrya sp. A25]|eukprot:GSA25T00015475001.1